MSKNRLSLRRLFSNTKFLIVFSIAVAFVFWIAVALEYAPIIEREIEDVPVVIDMENSVPSKFDLQIFGQQQFTVDITVRGSRFIVGGDLLSADDFDVTAQTAYVNSAGNHTLQIKATTRDAEAEYEIVKMSAEYIEVYFDKYEEKEISVEPRLITETSSVAEDGYLFDAKDILMPVNKLKISGAKTEIDNIEKAYADVNIDRKLTESLTVDAPISYEMELYDDIRYVTVSGDNDTIPVTIPIYKVETLKSSVDFRNIPSEYIDNPLGCVYTPSSFRAAVLQNGENDEAKVNVGTIDFNEISDKNNSFTFKCSGIKNIKVLDGTESVSVKINTGLMSSKKLEIKDPSLVFAANDMNFLDYDLSSIGMLTVIGPQSSLSKITDSSVSISVDSRLLEAGQTSGEIPVAITFKNINDCWIYGTYTMNISKK